MTTKKIVMNTKLKMISLFLSCLVLSCQNEPVDLSPTYNSSQNGKIINGRFYFSSKENLKTAIEQLKKEKNSDLEVKFEKLYSEGFRSHTPIVNPNNDELISKLSKEINSKNTPFCDNCKGTSVSEEEEDNSIGDPYFAAVVNQNDEIIVGDSIYKITKDLGVLFIQISDTTHLYEYLNTIKTGKTEKKASIQNIEPCALRAQKGGITLLDSKISRYIAPEDNDCGGNSGGGGGGGVSPPAPQISPDILLQNQINKLVECQPSKTSLFQNIFGTNIACINYFDSKHRIKTEFWNQSWLVYKSVGVQVRTQVKKVWIWWASEADEIYLGVNRIYMRFNFPEPKITYFNPSYSNPEVPVYMYKGEFNVQQYTPGILTNAPFIIADSGLPFFNFGGDILNIYIRKLPYLDNYDIKSERNIKAVYQLGINFLRNKINFDDPHEFVVSYQKSPTEIEVIYFGERYQSFNNNQIKRTFYKDTEFVVSATYNTTPYNPNSSTPYGNWKFKVDKPSQSMARNYTYFELDVYGLARKGSTWSGSRMIKY